jgi:hypothetical protein
MSLSQSADYGEPGSDMTRDEVFSVYRPLRQSIRHVLSLATKACNRADMIRAAKLLGLWVNDKITLDGGGEDAEMLVDLALFDPNQRGRVAYRSFLAEQGQQLEAGERALAERMSDARFTLLHYVGKHHAAGVWVEDLLAGDNRLWLMDEGLETSGSPGTVFGMRLFDAGPFHAGFGIITQPDEETIGFSVAGQVNSGRSPFRHSLAATMYADKLWEKRPHPPEQEMIVQILMDALEKSSKKPIPGRARKAVAKQPRGRSGKRRTQI